MKIAVPTCAIHDIRFVSILNTWWDNSLCMAFYAKDLGIEEKRENLGAKYKAICQALRDQDFVFFCDTDTYVHVPRLLCSGFAQHDFAGHTREGWEPPYPYGGPGFWLSRKALNILCDTDWREFTSPGMDYAADMTIGAILFGKIELHHDHRYSLYEDVLPENDIITRHLSSREAFRPEMMRLAHKKAHVDNS